MCSKIRPKIQAGLFPPVFEQRLKVIILVIIAERPIVEHNLSGEGGRHYTTLINQGHLVDILAT